MLFHCIFCYYNEIPEAEKTYLAHSSGDSRALHQHWLISGEDLMVDGKSLCERERSHDHPGSQRVTEVPKSLLMQLT
jgi:hypothetical protein